MPRPPDVAVLIESSTSWGIGLVRGIARYARENGPWIIFHEPRGRKERLLVPSDWEGQGVIARIDREELAQQIHGLGLPAVNVSWYDHAGGNIARVTNDEAAMAELAARHLADRGLRSFGVVPPHDRPGYRDLLTPTFKNATTALGGVCEVFDLEGTGFTQARWRERLGLIGEWLHSLTKPAGVIAFSDVHARQITEACRLTHLAVPDDICVLGCEHDELSSLISVPPLSSLHPNAEAVGYAAAELLDKMMNGEPAPAEPIRLPPGGIITRRSTDMLAIDDPELRAVCEYIREHSAEAISVEDLLDRVRMSRRVLERRFAKVFGRAPAAVIRRTRVEQAMRLLFDTDLSLTDIAARCGFGTTEVMARAFRSEFGATPSELRRSPMTTMPAGLDEPEERLADHGPDGLNGSDAPA